VIPVILQADDILGVGILVYKDPVFIPPQSTTGYRTAIHLIGVILGTHGCHQAYGDISAALHITFMHIGARSQTIIRQFEDGTVSSCSA